MAETDNLSMKTANNDDITLSSKRAIITIIDSIVKELKKEEEQTRSKDQNNFSYIQQRAMINQIFESTKATSHTKSSVMLRLIVIDSLYSTNAGYSYFSFEDMADKILSLGKDEGKTANDEFIAQCFYKLVMQERDKMSSKVAGLFSNKYGIRKNVSDGSIQTSLMSKYAYYVLLQNKDKFPLGFPIYDSLALEMYPKVDDKKHSATNSYKPDIATYINELNSLRTNIFGNNDLYNDYQQYDLLDAYLWRMGKLNNGNYSLLFNRKDYKQFIENIGLYQKSNKELYDKFKDVVLDGNKRSTSTKKNGDEKTANKLNFNKLVRYQCATMELEKILQGVSNHEHIKELIQHWKEFYLERNGSATSKCEQK